MKWTKERINNVLWGWHLNITDGAKMLGIGRGQMAKILNGDPEPSPPVQRLLDAYEDGYRPRDWIGKKAAEPEDVDLGDPNAFSNEEQFGENA